jgi:hypothetical protein
MLLERISPFGAVGLPVSGIERDLDRSDDGRMRVNLSVRRSGRSSTGTGTIPLTLSIRPACGLPGEYECPIDSWDLVRLLVRQTDLPEPVIRVFEENIRTAAPTSLLGVELSEKALTDIGYFID